MSAAFHVGMLGLPAGTLDMQRGAHGDAMAGTRVLTVVPAMRLARTRVEELAALRPSRSPVARDSGKAGTSAGSESGPGSDEKGLGVPGPHYYAPSEVSRHARVINDIPPLSAEMERAQDSGRMVLVLHISDRGGVDDVLVDQSDLVSPVASQLVARFRELHFHPAEIDGVAVNSRMKIEVILRPRTS